MINLPCDIVQEYRAPAGVTQFQIQAESSGPGGQQSNATVTVDVQPGGIVRVILRCTGRGQQQRGEK